MKNLAAEISLLSLLVLGFCTSANAFDEDLRDDAENAMEETWGPDQAAAKSPVKSAFEMPYFMHAS